MVKYIAPLLLLTGCAAQVVSSSPRTVVIDAGVPPKWKSADAQRLADAECAKHRRYARMVGRPNEDTREFVFDCIE